MASQYDSIQTPKDLITRVSIQGFSTKQEDICRAQDIFGRAPIEDLVFLANDIGRVNDNGEPDPEGTWSSGRRGTRDIFYQILFHIWNWEDATRFYNQHSNPDRKLWKKDEQTIKELKKQIDLLEESVGHKQETITRYSNQLVDANTEINETTKELSAANDRIAALELENIKLKARLYDMMMEKEGK